ncbi:MAG: tyrosine-type recombinase/integrase [Eubacteriaceae bacterium]|nr:tyrosine-type recombinase/integrase [Eubacteriaceae bacterium]
MKERYPDEANSLLSAGAADIYAYMEKSEKQEESEATMNRKLSSLKKYYGYLYSKGLISLDPSRDVKAKRVRETQRNPLTLEECRKLLSNINGRNTLRDRAIIMLFLSCCLTVGQVMRIKTEDIKENGILITDDDIGENLTIPISGSLKSILSVFILQERADARKYLFGSNDNLPIPKRTVQQIVTKHLKANGLYEKGISTQTLRITGAVLLRDRSGLNEDELEMFYRIKKGSLPPKENSNSFFGINPLF